MSLFAPRTESEAKFQYCNYGYSKELYTSFEDCMKNYDIKKIQKQYGVYDGGLVYQDSALIQAAIEKFKLQQEKEVTTPKPETILGNELTNGQKWGWVIGLTLAAWGLIYWSQKQPNR